MAGRRRCRNSTPRGAWYWLNTVPFRPQVIEADRAVLASRRKKPDRSLPVGKDQLPLYATAPPPEFALPVSVDDIAAVLEKLPRSLLAGLEGVYLLGGSQRHVVGGRSWGCYYRRTVFLFAAPRAWLSWRTAEYPGPELLHASPLWPRIRREGSSWLTDVDERDLRDFYLYDVLLHEVGHHVDFRRNGYRWRSRRKVERFAEWFAASYGKRLR